MTVGALVGPIWKPLRQPKRGEGYAPTQLLRAEHAVVPFLGRAQQVRDLEAWCQGGGTRVRVVHGPGGAGKTRLALEIAANRCREGWRAGPLAVWRDVEAPNEYLDALFRDKIPLFLIVDYAETRHDLLIRLLQRLARVEDCSARVLLVARGKGDWWDRAMAEVPDLDRMSFGWRDVRVDEAEGGAEHAEKAAETFAAWMGREVPRTIPDRGRTVLDRQVEALVAVLGGGPLLGMAQLLRHEDHFLLEAGGVVDLPRTLSRRLPGLIALYTLAGGVTPSEAREWLTVVDGLDDLRNAEARAAVELLADLYPREGGGVDGMRPDRVGEALVAREDEGGKLAEAAVDRGRGKAALTVLTRLGATGEEGPLRRVIDARREVLVEDVIAVAQETGDPVGRVCAQSLARRGDDAVALRIVDKLPVQSVALRELALVVTERVASMTTDGVDRAHYLSVLAKRRTDVGNHDGALAAVRDSVQILRPLAAAHPAGVLPSLARSLNNLSNALGQLGMYQEGLGYAEEALQIRRRLSAHGGVGAFPDLATSLGNLAVHLSKLGRPEEALAALEEAVALHRGLPQTRSVEVVSSFALALNNLSGLLSVARSRGRATATAAEAVSLVRPLAAADPDAFMDDLASTLTTFSTSLLVEGRYKEALINIQKAVELRRRLAIMRPSAFLLGLARSLNILSIALGSLGRHNEALGPAEETVEIDRRLAAARDVYLPQLGGSLNTLSIRLSRIDRHERALAAGMEAVAIRRRLVLVLPAAFLADLATSLNNLSNRFLNLGRMPEALAAIEEAVALRRRLAAERPDTFSADLATSLGNKALVEVGGSPMQAVGAAAEALATFVPLSYRFPAVFADKCREVREVYLKACGAANVAPDPTLLE